MRFAKRMYEEQKNDMLKITRMANELREQGKEIIDLSVGTPDFEPDKHVMDAMVEACQRPESYKYSIFDRPFLIDAVIGWYDRRYGVKLERDEVMSVNGSQEALAHISFPIIDVGDIVMVTNPGYPIFTYGPSLAGAKMYPMPIVEEINYLVDFDKIDPKVADQAKMMIISYPNNPVTATANYEFYEKLVAFAKKHDIIIVHDNAYSELIYDSEPGISFLAVPGAKDVGIELNSLSKSYNLTGCKTSFAVGNKEIIQKFKTVKSQIDYGMFLPAQYAAAAAITGPQDILDRNRRGYKERRDTFCEGLRSIGWNVKTTEATMFTWFKIPENYDNSQKFAVDLLNKASVVTVPGDCFGSLGEGYVRFALVRPVDVLNQVVENIKASGILK